jgi:hypothetical protein
VRRVQEIIRTPGGGRIPIDVVNLCGDLAAGKSEKFHSQKNRGKVEWAIAIFIDSRAYEEDYLEYEF